MMQMGKKNFEMMWMVDMNFAIFNNSIINIEMIHSLCYVSKFPIAGIEPATFRFLNV